MPVFVGIDILHVCKHEQTPACAALALLYKHVLRRADTCMNTCTQTCGHTFFSLACSSEVLELLATPGIQLGQH